MKTFKICIKNPKKYKHTYISIKLPKIVLKICIYEQGVREDVPKIPTKNPI
jgi:hypothetical protein